MLPMIDLRIEHLPRQIGIGQPFPIHVEIRNPGHQSIFVVPESTTFQDRRSPICQLEMRRVGDKTWINVSRHPDCGNTDPINLRDFQELAPGKKMMVTGDFYWSPQLQESLKAHPGDYEIRFIYNTSAPIGEWIGGPIPEPQHTDREQEILPRFTLVPKGIFQSRPVRVRFVAG